MAIPNKIKNNSLFFIVTGKQKKKKIDRRILSF